jgi:pimeloyl-ACP methyl ester carboxylesterase
LTRAEAIELATILDRWRRASPTAAQATGDGPVPELFSDTPSAVVDQWMLSSRGPSESALSKALNFTNAFTFWTMKERAGIVGSRGVYELVRALRDTGGPGLRIHLIGHSFGGRVVSAAIARDRTSTPNQVDSLILLQGAFSHFAFSTRDQIAGLGFPGDKGGLFESVSQSLATARPAVRGTMVAMYSRQDQPNQTLYPLASKIKGSDREAARVLRYGSIGADGFQGPPVNTLRLEGATREQISAALRGATPTMINADASNVVLGHSDLIHDEVFDLIWTAVLTSRQPSR